LFTAISSNPIGDVEELVEEKAKDIENFFEAIENDPTTATPWDSATFTPTQEE